jgi:hypothetical protein
MGTWQMNANGYRGELVITAVDPQGNLSGTVFGNPLVGFWDETAQKIFFVRNTNPADPSKMQVYTGFHFDANQPLFLEGGTVPPPPPFPPPPFPPPFPPTPPFQFRMLTGSFEAFAGTGGVASWRTYGWMARRNV